MLIGAYFIFFDNDKTNKDYNKIVENLAEKENYNEQLIGANLDIEEISEDDKYDYIITIDNVSQKKDNVRVLVMEDIEDYKDKHFPSFGVIDDKGYSIIPSNEQKREKEIKGLNLTILDSDKIECLLIYFACDGEEQFIRVNVASYLD